MMISTHGYVAARPELGRPDTGGQVVYVLELSKALGRLGYEVDILTRQFDGRAAVDHVAPRVRLLRFPCGKDRFIPKEFLAEYLDEWAENVLASPEIRGHRYAVVNSHYWDAGVAGEAVSKALRIPHVHTPHSLGVLKRDNDAWGAQGATAADNLSYRIRRERILYRRADQILATTTEQSQTLTESDDYNVPAAKLLQIPPGFDDEVFFPAVEGNRRSLKQQLGLDTPLIFTAGRVAPNKGFDLLIRALPNVLKQVPTARALLAIGSSSPSDSERDQLDKLRQLAAELGVQQQVMIANCVAQDQLADLYRAADVFVLCSRYEPFGLTAIEAMACGTPAVMTTHGGLSKDLGPGWDNVLCDPRDSIALGTAIARILQHPRTRRRMSQRMSQLVSQRYPWSVIARSFLAKVLHPSSSARNRVHGDQPSETSLVRPAPSQPNFGSKNVTEPYEHADRIGEE
jgi:mannosylfructose-phosphate synthase